MAVKSCGLRVGVLWTILMVLVHEAASQRHNCAREECVSLRECPQLVKLLRNPTSANIKTLQDATCFISGTNPMVCCPSTKTPKESLLPTICGQGIGNRIHGGEEAPLGDYPWMAAMGYKEIGFNKVEFQCGGSIINERYILTAAHCVAPELLALRNLEVIALGEWDLSTDIDCQVTEDGFRFCSDPSQNFTYDEIIVHPNYNTRAQYSDDIALIRLSKKIDLSGTWIHPICLPPQGFKGLNALKLANRSEAIVAGWGFTEAGSTSDRLLHVVLPFVDSQQCNATYSGNTMNEQICMGGRAGQDSCAGDSGGPLVVSGPTGPPYLQIGIVSYGPTNCGLQAVPGVYTDVSQYRNWIEENLRP